VDINEIFSLTDAVSLSSTKWNVGVGMSQLAILGQKPIRTKFFRGIPVLGIAMNVNNVYVNLTTLGQN